MSRNSKILFFQSSLDKRIPWKIGFPRSMSRCYDLQRHLYDHKLKNITEVITQMNSTNLMHKAHDPHIPTTLSGNADYPCNDLNARMPKGTDTLLINHN